jgi:hypothetical protein
VAFCAAFATVPVEIEWLVTHWASRARGHARRIPKTAPDRLDCEDIRRPCALLIRLASVFSGIWRRG